MCVLKLFHFFFLDFWDFFGISDFFGFCFLFDFSFVKCQLLYKEGVAGCMEICAHERVTLCSNHYL